MSIPPCTTGKHSTTDKPPAIEKKEAPESTDVSRSTTPANEQTLPTRTPVAAPQSTATPPPPPPESEDDDPSLEIPDGKTCRRRACGHQYKAGSERSNEKCVYHPGAPLFHEGSKGYTCCKRRVLEFDEFMKIEGCKEKDQHLFMGSGKKKATAQNGTGEEVVESVRTDFYQTATTVIASFFLKKINKETAKIEFASETDIILDLPTTDQPPKRYRNTVQLFGPIKPTESGFKVLGTKLELTLVKADGSSWPVLRSEDPRTGEIIQVGRAGRAV
jgi:hypothetical protein